MIALRYLFYPFLPFLAVGKAIGSAILLLFPMYREILALEQRLNNDKAKILPYVWKMACQSALWDIHNRIIAVLNPVLYAFLINFLAAIILAFRMNFAVGDDLLIAAWFLWIVPSETVFTLYRIGRPSRIKETLTSYRRADAVKRAMR